MKFLLISIALLVVCDICYSYIVPSTVLRCNINNSNTLLYAKKNKNKKKYDTAPSKSQQASRADQFNARVNEFMFTIQGLSKTIPDGSREILKKINLCFFPGAKIGVVGLNGSGKSSLLRIMAGVDTSFDGVAVPMPSASVGYLPQEPQLEGTTVMDNINMGVAKGQALLDEFNELSVKCGEPLSDDEMAKVMDDLANLQDKIDAGNLWELDRLKDRAMQALRCPPPDADVSVLSGGERRRVALARLLLENHDLLLLDEPTNHLDCDSIAWLERYLQEFKGTVVAITHDRYFLDKSCGWILELDRGEGVPYEGNYSGWLEKKRQKLDDEKRQDDRLKKQLEAELEWVRSTPKAKGTKSKSRLTRYEELLTTPAREGLAHTASIYIPPGPRLGDVVVNANGISKSYGDRTLIKDLSFEIPPGAIVGVVGPNGAGKSTLVKMIMGTEQPDGGSFQVGETVKLAIVDQGREGLEGTNSVYEEICGGQDIIQLGNSEVNGRAYCSWFGFKGSDQQKKVEKISGGERNRVQLAKVLRSGCNMIILDEPTNDLDVGTISSLEEALLEFAGNAIVVSHDRYFLDRIATHILAYEDDGRVEFYTGNYQEYEDYKQNTLGETPKSIKYATLA